MKRRNFILGLGTITTISSGAALTGASLANSVTPTSNFQVLAGADLTVQKGDGFDSTASDYQGSSLSFSDLTASDTPIAYVNDSNDGSLELETAVEADSGITHTFTGILKVVNSGTTTEDVGITWNEFGADTTGTVSSNGGAVRESEVENTYTFYADASGDGTRSTEISPDSNDGTPANTVTVDAGETVNIDLEVAPSSGLVSDIENNVSSAGNTDPWSGDYQSVDLVDSINVGSQ